MKKNISINLQGIIFHIEEDGYEQLSRYLASIRTYFSTYEGHEEIIADIESRIAEIFASRLSPGKEVITLEDVQSLIAQMGDVTDFELLDAEEETSNAGSGSASYAHTTSGPRKLCRDINRKVVAGVAAGIANYLNIDTLWVRLFFIFMILLGIISSGFSTATGLILYIILWMAMPQSDLLPETAVKKLFRDSEDKKLAGVASGIAKYFGVDVAVVRFLFLLSIFLGGFGVLAYIVLWIAVPEAVTLTERMQMQGNPVTLSGIEQSLKENLNMKDSNGEENTLARLILLPIRLISQVFSWMGRVLGPLLVFLTNLIRVGTGVILLIVSVGLTVALFVALFVSMGLIDQNFMFDDYPASILLEGFPRLGLVAGFFVGLIPFIFILILGAALISRRFFLRQIVGWSMFAVWLVSLFTLIAVIVIYTQNFRRTGEVETTKAFNVDAYNTITLDAFNTDMHYRYIRMDVKSHTGNNIEVIQRVQARGKNEEDARYNAQMVTYRIVQKDSVLRFDNNFEFEEGAALRNQNISLLLLLPQNKPLRLTSSFLNMLPNAAFDVEYSREKVLRNTWQAKGDYLTCLTCEADTLGQTNTSDYVIGSQTESVGSAGSVLLNMDEYSSNVKVFEESEFDRIEINGPFHVQIRQGREYDLRIHADESELEKVNISKDGSELIIESRQKYINLFDNKKPLLIQITAPDLRSLELNGAMRADIGRIETNELDLHLSGAIRSSLNINAHTLKADISGAAHSTFAGRVNRFELNAAGASMMEAENLIAEVVHIDASGACVTKVHATRSLNADASGGSSITYSGNPSFVNTDVSGASKIKRK